MAYNYVVTAQSSTSVHQCLKANITGKDDVNLLVAKGRNLELSLSTAEGLKPMLVTPIRGHIEVMLAYRPEVNTSFPINCVSITAPVHSCPKG